jgi:uncharacterized protein YqeY
MGMRDRLQAGLVEAMKTRDADAVKAVRSALAAIANAEAVTDTHGTSPPGDRPIPASARGLGAGDVPRRSISEIDVLDIIGAEVEDRIQSARQYDALGQTASANELRAQARVLKLYLHS